jgi:hypothetical protein
MLGVVEEPGGQAQPAGVEDRLHLLVEQMNAAHRRVERATRRSQDANREAVAAAIESGDALIAALQHVKHGDKVRWIEQNFEGSVRTSQLYRHLAERRQEAQRVAHLGVKGADQALSNKTPFDHAVAADLAHTIGLGDQTAGFVSACTALVAIKAGGLFRATDRSMQDYLERRWGLDPHWVLSLLRDVGDVMVDRDTTHLGDEEATLEANREDFIAVTQAWIDRYGRARSAGPRHVFPTCGKPRKDIKPYAPPSPMHRAPGPTPGQLSLQYELLIGPGMRVDKHESHDAWPQRRNQLVRRAVAETISVAEVVRRIIEGAAPEERHQLEQDRLALTIEAQKYLDRATAP